MTDSTNPGSADALRKALEKSHVLKYLRAEKIDISDLAEELHAALSADAALSQPEPHDEGHPHLIRGEFQSDKYPTCPRGKVPLSVKDATAQDLLWEYAQRRRSVDAEFATDLEKALRTCGYDAALSQQVMVDDAKQRSAERGIPVFSRVAKTQAEIEYFFDPDGDGDD